MQNEEIIIQTTAKIDINFNKIKNLEKSQPLLNYISKHIRKTISTNTTENVEKFQQIFNYISEYIDEHVRANFHKISSDSKIHEDEINTQIDITTQLVIDKIVEAYQMIIHDKAYQFIIQCNNAIFEVFNQMMERALFFFDKKLYTINILIFNTPKFRNTKKLCLLGNQISNIEWIPNIFSENLNYISLRDNNICNIRTLKKY